MRCVRSRLAAVAAVLCVALSAVPRAAALPGDPIDPQNRPTPLAGAVNGEVPPTRLVRVTGTCVAAREAGPSIHRIFAMARQTGIALDAEECYRPLVDQVRYDRAASRPGANRACVAVVRRAPDGKPIGTSYHGWGKAADLVDAAGSLRFSSPGFWVMRAVAGSLGWNHPAFAQPGQPCPEPWHWEWVGDGGSLGRSPRRGDVVALLPSADDGGYATVTGLGALGTHGTFVSRGSALSIPIAWVVVGAAATPNRGGYWLVGKDGGVFTFGNARFFGSTGAMRLNEPVNGIAAAKNGNGYWLVAWDGGVFSFGGARFRGSMGGKPLARPVVGIAATPSGNGYWLVASDGGVFSFGDARFRGSMGGTPLASPVVGMAATKSGNGYWLVASDGGVFTFGDARFRGSLGGFPLSSPAVGILPTKSGNGYWIVLADGQVAAFGDAAWHGNG
jgi:hypothetical protein